MKKYTIKLKILPEYVNLYPECENGIMTIFVSELQFETTEKAKSYYETLYLSTLAESITVESEDIDLGFDVKSFLDNDIFKAQ